MPTRDHAAGDPAPPVRLPRLPPGVAEVLRSPGRPLDPGARSYLEPRFGRILGRVDLTAQRQERQLAVDPEGDRHEREAERIAAAATGEGGRPRAEAPGHDFSRVRVHAGERAAAAARSLDARAFTVGRDIVFGAGEYAPHTPAGRRLLAHELTHVVQQADAAGRPAAIQRQKQTPAAPEGESWEPDEDGELYYKTKAEAETRMKHLEKAEPGAKLRVRSFGRKGATLWRVEISHGKAAAPAPGKAPPAATTTPRDTTAPAATTAPRDTTAPSAPAATSAPAAGATRTFALTFDDGPDSQPLNKGVNRTEKVLDVLKARGIKAGFFVQTAAVDPEGHAFRGSTPVGKQLLKRMQTEGHKIGIHTGGKKDHEKHTKAQAAGRLEPELQAAKAFIKQETGTTPTLVRPPGGTGMLGKHPDKAMLATYAKVSLTGLVWDMDGDKGATSLKALKQNVETEMIKVRDKNHWKPTTPSPNIVVLYHDIRANTANNIGDVIDHIKATTQTISGGKDTAQFAAP